MGNTFKKFNKRRTTSGPGRLGLSAALIDIDRGALGIGEADDLRGFDDGDPALADDPVARFDGRP